MSVRTPMLLAALLSAVLSAPHVAAQGLPTASPAELGLSPAALDRIAPALQPYVDSGKVSGLVMVVARHGKVGYSQAIGFADIATKAPMRVDGVFRIFSMTKPIIAVGVMRLAEQGKLRLGDPVAKFIPAFADAKLYGGAQPSGGSITIEQLLTHTSGLTYGFFGQTAVDSVYRRANLLDWSRTTRQFADSIAQLPLLYSPGSQWVYSMSLDVLGAVIEVASGLPLDQYLEREIFTPLGMRETGFHVTAAMEGRIPVSYARGQGGKLQGSTPLVGTSYQPASKLLSGGGGLLSTPADYLRFAQMLLNGGELDGHRIISREGTRDLMRDHLPPSLSPLTSPMVGLTGYGFGLGGAVLVDSALSRQPGSPGIYRWWGIAGTFFWVDPKADLIGMIWTQLTPGRAYPIEQDFQRLVYSAVETKR